MLNQAGAPALRVLLVDTDEAVGARLRGLVAEMLVRLGVGFATGFVNEIWRAYCSSTMMLGFRMGGQFEVQDASDHWHPLVMLMKRLGLPGACRAPILRHPEQATGAPYGV